MRALSLGAVDVIAKPGAAYSVPEVGRDLVRAIRAAAVARIVKRDVDEAPAAGSPKPPAPLGLKTTHTVLAIGASTGGTKAIEAVLTRMPADSPATLVVQHMPPGFTKSFAVAQELCQWFVGGIGTAFLAPAAQTFGSYPINTLIGPQFIQQDLTLAKSFKITERYSFRLRADAANAFNHTNLGWPNADVQASNAGQITGLAAAGSMRRLQFSGTVSF